MCRTNTEDIIEAQKGNREALSQIVEKNSGLIWSIVKRFMGRGYLRRRIVSNWSYSDL